MDRAYVCYTDYSSKVARKCGAITEKRRACSHSAAASGKMKKYRNIYGLLLLCLSVWLLCACHYSIEDPRQPERAFFSYTSMEKLRGAMGEEVLLPLLSSREAATVDAVLSHYSNERYAPDRRVGNLRAEWKTEAGESLRMEVDFTYDANPFGGGIPFETGDREQEFNDHTVHVREDTEENAVSCTVKFLWESDFYRFTLTRELPVAEEENEQLLKDLLQRVPLPGSMENLLGPREEIIDLAGVEQKAGFAQYVYVCADEEEKKALLDLIYDMDTKGFFYAEPQPYTPPLGEALDMEKTTLVRARLSVQTAQNEYAFVVLTQGETAFLQIYEMPPFGATAEGEKFSPSYICCSAGEVDVTQFEALISAMNSSTTDAQRCAEAITLATMERTVLSKKSSAELRFYLENAFLNDASGVPSAATYTLELHYADVLFRVNTETGDCLRNDGTEELQTTLEPGDLMRAKIYWNTALN